MIPAILFILTVAWLLGVEGRQGIGRDEAQYFRAGERYYGFFESAWNHLREGHPGKAFSQSNVDAFFSDNHEHPALMKILFGLSWRAFHTCDCNGPERGLHPIPITGKHVTLPLFKRILTAAVRLVLPRRTKMQAAQTVNASRPGSPPITNI